MATNAIQPFSLNKQWQETSRLFENNEKKSMLFMYIPLLNRISCHLATKEGRSIYVCQSLIEY